MGVFVPFWFHIKLFHLLPKDGKRPIATNSFGGLTRKTFIFNSISSSGSPVHFHSAAQGTFPAAKQGVLFRAPSFTPALSLGDKFSAVSS